MIYFCKADFWQCLLLKVLHIYNWIELIANPKSTEGNGWWALYIFYDGPLISLFRWKPGLWRVIWFRICEYPIPSLFSPTSLIYSWYWTNSLLQDNDLYEEPQGDYNYEPPPSEKVFTPPRSVNYTGGEYLGKFCYHVIMISWSQTSRSC